MILLLTFVRSFHLLPAQHQWLHAVACLLERLSRDGQRARSREADESNDSTAQSSRQLLPAISKLVRTSSRQFSMFTLKHKKKAAARKQETVVFRLSVTVSRVGVV